MPYQWNVGVGKFFNHITDRIHSNPSLRMYLCRRKKVAGPPLTYPFASCRRIYGAKKGPAEFRISRRSKPHATSKQRLSQLRKRKDYLLELLNNLFGFSNYQFFGFFAILYFIDECQANNFITIVEPHYSDSLGSPTKGRNILHA